MGEYSQYIIPVLTAALAWFGANIKTRREKKKTDLQIINEAIKPLLTSITELTNHNRELTGDLVEQQTDNLKLLEEKRAWLAERGDLLEEMGKLRKQVDALAKEVKKLRGDKDAAKN